MRGHMMAATKGKRMATTPKKNKSPAIAPFKGQYKIGTNAQSYRMT